MAGGSDEKLGSAYAEIYLKNLIDQGIKDANKSLENAEKGFNKRMQNISVGFKDAGDSMTKTFTVPIVAGFTAAGYAALSFEDQLAGVRKTTGASAEELAVIGDELLRYSRTTRTATSELIAIATAAGQIGVKTKDVVEFTKSIDKLNVALGDEFSGGAEQITKELGTLRALFSDIKTQDPADDMLKIGNALNTLGASGLATGEVVADFANRIVGLTGTLGNGSGDILGLSAALQELGVNAERGGSNVGRIMAAIAKDTDKFSEALGINAKEFKKLVNEDINEAFLLVAQKAQEAGASNVELAQIFNDLGVDAVGMSEVLSKVGANVDFVREKQDLANVSLGNTESIMSEYNTINETGAANIAKLGSIVQELAIRIGGVLAPAIAEIVTKVGGFVDKIIEFFTGLTSEQQKLILVIAGVVAAVGPVLLIVAKIISVIGILSAAVGVVGGVFAALSGPVLAIVAVVAAVVAGFVLLEQKFGFVSSAIGFVKDAFTDMFNRLKESGTFDRIQESVGKLIEAFQRLQPLFLVVAGIVGGALALAFGVALSIFESLISGISPLIDIITGLINIIANLAKFTIQIFKGDFKGAFDTFLDTFKQIGKVIAGVFKYIIGIVVGFVTGIINFFKNLFNVLVGNSIIPDMVLAILNWIKNMAMWVLSTISTFVTGFVAWIVNLAMWVLTTVTQFVMGFWQWIVNLGTWVLTTIGEFVVGFVAWIVNMGVWVLTTISEFVLGFWQWIQNLASWVLNTISQFVTGFWGWITTMITWVIDKIKTFVGNIVQGFIDLKNKAIEKIREWVTSAKELAGELVTNVTDKIGELKTKVEEKINDVKDFFIGIKDEAIQWGKDIAQSFVDGFLKPLDGLKDKVADKLGPVGNFIKGNSPPKAGPLKHIDDWGYNIGDAWAASMSAGMANIDVPAAGDMGMQGLYNIKSEAGDSNVFNFDISGNTIDSTDRVMELRDAVLSILARENVLANAGQDNF